MSLQPALRDLRYLPRPSGRSRRWIVIAAVLTGVTLGVGLASRGIDYIQDGADRVR